MTALTHLFHRWREPPEFIQFRWHALFANTSDAHPGSINIERVWPDCVLRS